MLIFHCIYKIDKLFMFISDICRYLAIFMACFMCSCCSEYNMDDYEYSDEQGYFYPEYQQYQGYPRPPSGYFQPGQASGGLAPYGFQPRRYQDNLYPGYQRYQGSPRYPGYQDIQPRGHQVRSNQGYQG